VLTPLSLGTTGRRTSAYFVTCAAGGASVRSSGRVCIAASDGGGCATDRTWNAVSVSCCCASGCQGGAVVARVRSGREWLCAGSVDCGVMMEVWGREGVAQGALAPAAVSLALAALPHLRTHGSNRNSGSVFVVKRLPTESDSHGSSPRVGCGGCGAARPRQDMPNLEDPGFSPFWVGLVFDSGTIACLELRWLCNPFPGIREDPSLRNSQPAAVFSPKIEPFPLPIPSPTSYTTP
jgi:hypothetical protein